MPSLPLQRTVYVDLTVPPPTPPPPRDNAWPVNSGGLATHDSAEPDRDLEGYVRGLEQIHGSGLHEWGIADGLEVIAVAPAKFLTVRTGIAIDALGRHVSLARGASAELDPKAPDNPPTTAVPPSHVAVTNTGVKVPVDPTLSGDYVLTIQWRETFDSTDWTWTHMPLIWFQERATFKADGLNGIPLATATLNGGVASNVNDTFRRDTIVPAGALHLRAPNTDAPTGENQRTTVSDPDAGYVRGMSYTVDGDRGVAITVPKKNNVVRVKAEVAQGGRLVDRSLNEVSLRADQVKVQKDDGATTVRFDSALGNVIAGGSGVEGDVIAVDANGDLMVVLDGGQPEVVVGGPQHPGAVRVLDGNQTDEVKLDGAAGDVWFRGALRNLANPAQGPITHALLQSLFPLTGGGLTSLHRHLPVGDATTARVVFIRMPAFSTAPFTVPVFVTGPIVACIMLARYGAGSLGGAAVADISDIDGSLPPFGASAAGFFGGSIFAGTVTTSVTLRLASSFFAAAFAVGLVFTK